MPRAISLSQALSLMGMISSGLFCASCVGVGSRFSTRFADAALPSLKGKQVCGLIASVSTAPPVALNNWPNSIRELEDALISNQFAPARFQRAIAAWNQIFTLDGTYILSVETERHKLISPAELTQLTDAINSQDKLELTGLHNLVDSRFNANAVLNEHVSFRRAVDANNQPEIQKVTQHVLSSRGVDVGLIMQDRLDWQGRIYNFKSRTMLLDKSGKEIWSSCSSGTVVAPFDVDSLLTRAVGMSVSPDAVVRFYQPFINDFPKLTVALFLDDLNGRPHKIGVGDYLGKTDLIIDQRTKWEKVDRSFDTCFN
jgi:hypothetical protein